MESGRDKKGEQPGAKPTGKPAGKPDTPGGRITVDGRGRNIWKWENEHDSTSILLKQLENDALALEPTRNLRRPDVGAEAGQTPERPTGAAGKEPGPRDSTGRDARGRIQQYPDRSGTRARDGKGPKRSAGKPSGPRRSGGFDPYNNG